MNKSTRYILQTGFTLVELMVSMVIGLLIVLALVTLLINVNRNNSEMSKTNRQIENGRFALQVLQNDLIHAGFWGALRPATPTAIPDACLAVASWDAAYKLNMLAIPVLGFNSSSIPASCSAVTGAQANSDVLVVRHANTCVAGGANCDGGADTGLHIQVSACTTTPPEAAYVIAAPPTSAASVPVVFSLKEKNCATFAVRRKIVSNIYYVSNNTLMRVPLVNGVYQTTQPMIEGIEAMRIEYGIDSDANGSADTYVSCAPCTLAQLVDVVAVKIHVLARNLEATPGYTDSKSYQLGATATIAAVDDGFKRHVYSTTVRLVNPSGRREVPP
jgi:type IV pilus assembly protein PilW